MDERHAYIAFNLTPGIGPQRLQALIKHCGSATAAWSASLDDWRAAGLDRRTIQALQHAQQHLDLEAELRTIAEQDIKVVLQSDPEFPALLQTIDPVPPLLYMRGSLIETDRWAVAIVGTRNPTPYGREVTYKFAGELARAGLTVVSGLALGIDAMAHRTALENNGRTLAVLGSGLQQIYPAQHRQLAHDLSQQGALLSEYAPTTEPLSGNFPARNRLISGLSLATIVVEAGERSGALITARFALDQGRDVFAVPGSILSHSSDGPNQLIVDGATPLRNIDQVLEQLNLHQAQAQQTVSSIVPETPAEALLLPYLSGQPTHIDDLGRACGLAAHDLSATLGLMELKGMVRHVGGMHYVLARETPAPYDLS